jgi:phospholipid/cholesterol/gamma-HCH transport system substrate-binding protein
MNERIVQFRVGVTVVAAVIIAMIMVVLFDGLPRIGRDEDYTIYINFNEAPGVSEGTPIRKSGILIGRVATVDFAEDLGKKPRDGVRVIVTAQIQAKRKLRHNEIPKIGKSLLGDAVIEFVQEPLPDQTNKPIEPGDEVTGRVISDPLQAIGNIEGNLSIAINSVSRTSNEVGRLAMQINDLLENNNEQISRIVGKVEATFDRLQTAVANADDILGDPKLKDNIRHVVAELPHASQDLSDAMKTLKQVMASADRNLGNIEGLTKPLGDRGPQLVASIERTAQMLDNVLRDVQKFSRSINSPDGSLGKLINDPALYQQLQSAVENVGQLSRELKPILHDARTFTDKAARHPESFGVRGAIFPNSGIK